MSKILCWLIIFSLSLSSIAATSNVVQMNQALDEYQYAMTVEWDQKDLAFQKEKMEVLFRELKVLQEKGLTPAEMEANFKLRGGQISGYQHIFASLNSADVGSMDELVTFLNTGSKNTYLQGASWISDDVIGMAEYAFIAAFLGYIIYVAVTEKCVEYGYVGTHHTCTKMVKRKFHF